MRQRLQIDEDAVRDRHDGGEDDTLRRAAPNRLLTAFEVADGSRNETQRGVITPCR
jgi:hypothetical protein